MFDTVALLVERDQLAKQLLEAQKDARRYLFLCGADVPQSSTRWSRWKLEYWDGFHGGWQPLTGTELDEKIDAEMQAERVEQKP